MSRTHHSTPAIPWSLLLMLMLMLLAGCASMVPPARDGLQAQPYHERIEIAGRLSLRYQQGGSEQSMHGSFVWEQQPQQTRLTLLSPLGQTMAVIAITPTRSTLTQGGQPPLAAPDVDSLVRQSLGWPLPISGLRDWLQARATDAHGQAFTAVPNHAEYTITSDGWALKYADWQGAPDSGAHARRIDLARNTDQAGDVVLRIVIDDWHPLDSKPSQP